MLHSVGMLGNNIAAAYFKHRYRHERDFAYYTLKNRHIPKLIHVVIASSSLQVDNAPFILGIDTTHDIAT